MRSSARAWYLFAALLLVLACVHRAPMTKSPKTRPSPARTPIAGDEGTTAEEGTSGDEGTTAYEDEPTTEDDGDMADGDEPVVPEHPEPPTVLPGNIVFQTLRAGAGRRPTANEYVRVRYVGRFADGRVFDDSKDHGGELGFYLNQVIRCWTTGVTHMNVGGKARLTCPPDTAYGARGVPPTIPPNATLEFDIDLVAIQPRR